MRNLILNIFILFGKFLSVFRPLNGFFKIIHRTIYTGYYSTQFKHFGRSSRIEPNLLSLIGGKYISVGENCHIGKGAQISAWDSYGNQKFNPEISIGDGTIIFERAHITCLDKITIGKNVLTGKSILITDNSHGDSSYESLSIPPIDRPLHSKGPVVIEDNVWIGEKASIMPGVKIGKGAIIAANSVVTKDIPAFSIAAGVPARVIKTAFPE